MTGEKTNNPLRSEDAMTLLPEGCDNGLRRRPFLGVFVLSAALFVGCDDGGPLPAAPPLQSCGDAGAEITSIACGLNGRGVLTQVCDAGQWGDTNDCVDPDVCTDDAEQNGTTVCGFNNEGVRVQACVSGQWSDTVVRIFE